MTVIAIRWTSLHSLDALRRVQDHDVTHAKVYSAYQARSIQRIDFLTTFTDASPDGPPGDYTVTYRCQYSYNGLNTNPLGNLVQIPVRLLALHNRVLWGVSPPM